MISVQITGLGSVPRAVVIERPSWWRVLFLGEYQSEWQAYAVERIVRLGGRPCTEWIWYRDSREQRPVRVAHSIECQLEKARSDEIAIRAQNARLEWFTRRP